MVLINNQKYACETCIKGHRSSACKHTDRPLFEIKKKGRPVTQCEHCRELRKTKQVHIKCVCEAKEKGEKEKEDTTAAPHGKKDQPKVLESAAFLQGLSRAPEASVALQPSTEGTSSESDRGESASCCCGPGVQCQCWTPRKSAPRNKRTKSHDKSTSSVKAEPQPPSPLTPQAPAHILARVAEFRPVLPRPGTSEGPVHDPSSGMSHSTHRHHTHEEHYFSPYGRAYDYSHTSSHDSQESLHPQPVADLSQNSFANALGSFEDLQLSNDLSTGSWAPTFDGIASRTGSDQPSLSFCGCGDGCRCPGCVVHNDVLPQASAFASCADPHSCVACLECSIASFSNEQGDAAPPTENFDVDDWIRLLSSVTPDVDMPMPDDLGSEQPPALPATLSTGKFDRTSHGLNFSALQGLCGGSCVCPPGFCQCNPSSSNFCNTPSFPMAEDAPVGSGPGMQYFGEPASPMERDLPHFSADGMLLGIPELPRRRSPSSSSLSSGQLTPEEPVSPFNLQAFVDRVFTVDGIEGSRSMAYYFDTFEST